ncbi:SRPBCC family protein [Sphaerobacter thermophilus]|uniref:Activator of Hsp90 ATPase 1 family protein n=1 Tax=Sphaerobacter thermophilus (strain ATCC 49802 / DSM 20745 / KCCM 41009 / NCIMB 13125 / S 6022) TaxID=479434 RepID=D1C5J8_SPHTD|nr:SRPBCC family protein [Sphaerobacter thermophilus]ACZ37514.1 Activator of Hsp90 ATPase 1 family protein [Sphaerobacter thermophilus DSM 20745]
MTVDDLRLTHIPDVTAGMLIRRPACEVFQAFADPAVTTRFWFTKSTGMMKPGAVLRWDWEMFGVSAQVRVQEVEENRRIRFTWDDENPTTVEFRFVPWREEATYVQVTESGFSGSGDEVVARVADATGGYYQVLCAAKALLEHGVVLSVVLDHAPPEGLEL